MVILLFFWNCLFHKLYLLLVSWVLFWLLLATKELFHFSDEFKKLFWYLSLSRTIFLIWSKILFALSVTLSLNFFILDLVKATKTRSFSDSDYCFPFNLLESLNLKSVLNFCVKILFKILIYNRKWRRRWRKYSIFIRK